MRGIRRPKEHSALIDMLDQRDPATGEKVFPFKKATLCYAAVLGFQRGKKVTLPEGNLDTIEWHTFQNGDYTDYIYLVALAHTRDVNVLGYDVATSNPGDFPEDMVGIFEEYANGGLEIMQGWLRKRPDDVYGRDAIISGLKKHGFLDLTKEVDEAAFDNDVF